MPLMHSNSKAAFSHNVKAEREAGKPMKQALAIAYSEKRAASSHNESLGMHHAMHHMKGKKG